jgi:hypothetical protein
MNKKNKCFTLGSDYKSVLGLFSIFSLSLLTAMLLLLVTDLSMADTAQVRAQSSDSGSEGVSDSGSEGVSDSGSEGVSDSGSEGVKDFVANGHVNSTLYTLTGNWAATGKWALAVDDGKVTSFNTDMVWNNGTAGHTHEFRNFVADNDNIVLGPDRTVSIKGVMDVGSNRAISWTGIPAEIFIEKGKIITVSLDDEGTNKHFGGQSIHGTVDAITQCGLKPGPEMEMPSTSC